MKNITSPCKVFTSLWVRLQSCESEKSGKAFTKATRCSAELSELKRANQRESVAPRKERAKRGGFTIYLTK